MTYKLAIAQLRGAAFQADANRDRTLACIREAASAGARLIVLPELIVSGYVLDEAGLRSVAEPLDGPTLAAWAAIARELGVHVAGGFCEADADGRLYNSAVLVGPGGLVLHYRKLHLFDREKLIFTPGDLGLPVAETPLGRIGLCVCYDLRFVEVLRTMALLGAEIAAVPTAWVGGFDLKAREDGGHIGQTRGVVVQANLDQIYVACASQCGRDDRTRFLGSSIVADPYGEALVGPMDEAEEAIGYADIDLRRVATAQARSELVRPRTDRRTDVYGVTLGGRPL